MIQALTLAALLAVPQQDRPRDIWVFRSVLDKHARMMTAHLHKDLFVAYDATYCGLYEAWSGDVKLDGSVYTTVHGPQPTVEGSPFIKNDPTKNTWNLVVKGDITPIQPQYKGYKIVNNQVQVQIEFKLPNGQIAKVTETPEAVPGTSTIGLSRTFVSSNLPANTTLAVTMNYRPADMARKANVDSQWLAGNQEADWATGTIFLNPNKTTTATFTFNKNKTQSPQPRPAIQQDQTTAREPGLAHRLYVIGDQFDQMPRLIPGQTPNYSVVAPSLNFGEKSFGDYGDFTVSHITGFLNVQTAGNYEFRMYSDDGARLTINDALVGENKGLRGMGDKPAVGSVDLKAGENTIFVEHFQGQGGIGLNVQWKKPGDTEFTNIPAEALTTPKGEVRLTAPGKKRIFGQLMIRPGDRQWLDGVHPSFNLSQARPDGFHPKVGGIDFLSNGDMVICNWEPDGGVYQISNWDGPKERIKVKRIAFGLAEPLGLKVVNDKIYVLQKQELTQLIDNDKDGEIDEYKCIANGWGVTPNFHEFAFGLVYRNGKFYGNLATAINPGGASTSPQNWERGRSIEIDPRTGAYKFVTAGLRTPNGIGFGAKGQVYISDNQGDWLPSSKILLLRQDAFYGNRSVDPEGTKGLVDDPPVVWLPQNEIGNSPSNVLPFNYGPYKDQMLHGDVTHGGLKRVFVEVVDGVYQGVVFRMTQGLESGVNRAVVAPDKSIIIGGVGSSGNWGQIGKLPFGLQRLSYNGKSTFEMLEVHAKSNGMEIVLTEPLAAGVGDSPDFWRAEQWRYVPTIEYGGPKVDEEVLPIKSVTVSSNRKKVFLELDGMKQEHVVYLRAHTALKSQSEQPIWSTEAWYTLNRIPKAKGSVRPAKLAEPDATLSATESEDGFEVLFDGSNLDNFKGWKTDVRPAGWQIENGSVVLDPKATPGGDLVTKEMYGDFELRTLWKISEGGNSGIIYRSTEDQNAAYVTGPEYQILDNIKGADGKNPFTSAGSFYALYDPAFDVTMPVGYWNETRIVVKGNIAEHYLNGHLLTRVDMGSEEFKYRVANSKFKNWPTFATRSEGHIVFQHHGNPVAYRNIRIKRL